MNWSVGIYEVYGILVWSAYACPINSECPLHRDRNDSIFLVLAFIVDKGAALKHYKTSLRRVEFFRRVCDDSPARHRSRQNIDYPWFVNVICTLPFLCCRLGRMRDPP